MKVRENKISSMLGISRFRALLRKGYTRLPADFNFQFGMERIAVLHFLQ